MPHVACLVLSLSLSLAFSVLLYLCVSLFLSLSLFLFLLTRRRISQMHLRSGPKYRLSISLSILHLDNDSAS